MTADSTPDGLLGRVEGTLAKVASEHYVSGYDDLNWPICRCKIRFLHLPAHAQHVAAMQVAALVDEYGLAESTTRAWRAGIGDIGDDGGYDTVHALHTNYQRIQEQP